MIDFKKITLRLLLSTSLFISGAVMAAPSLTQCIQYVNAQQCPSNPNDIKLCQEQYTALSDLTMASNYANGLANLVFLCTYKAVLPSQGAASYTGSGAGLQSTPPTVPAATTPSRDNSNIKVAPPKKQNNNESIRWY